MPNVNPYLTFNGNCAEAFEFYKSVFGGEFAMLSHFSDVPQEQAFPREEAKKVLHVSLPIGNGTVLMGSDRPSVTGLGIFGNNFSISINTDSEAQTQQLFDALSAGGKVMMPPEKTFWGSYFGMLTDRFQINWMLSYTYPKP